MKAKQQPKASKSAIKAVRDQVERDIDTRAKQLDSFLRRHPELEGIATKTE